jgi:hypothetical protein
VQPCATFDLDGGIMSGWVAGAGRVPVYPYARMPGWPSAWLAVCPSARMPVWPAQWYIGDVVNQYTHAPSLHWHRCKDQPVIPYAWPARVPVCLACPCTRMPGLPVYPCTRMPVIWRV